MERGAFIKFMAAGTALSLFNPLKIADLFIPEREVVLPFLDGNEKVTILKKNESLISELKAQYVYYGNPYNNGVFAQQQQWYNYQQAAIAWQQQLMAWQQQRHYAWLQQQHIQQMEVMLQHYQNYSRVGAPKVWPAIESIYGQARDSSGTAVLFGLNQDEEEVSIQKTYPAANKLFRDVNNRYGRAMAEKVVGPQSDEEEVEIELPDASTLTGTAYATNGDNDGGGYVAVSDDEVRLENGRRGQLVKSSSRLGIKYGIV